jgi:hypothetical protein
LLEGYAEMDLHECPAAVARAVLRCVLRDLEKAPDKPRLLPPKPAPQPPPQWPRASSPGSGDQSSAASALWPLVDLYVVTGRGRSLGQKGNNAPQSASGKAQAVLPSATRAWLKAVGGPDVSRVVGNTGCFVLIKADLEAWRNARIAANGGPEPRGLG